MGPGCLSCCSGERRERSLATRRTDLIGWTAEDGGLTETHGPEEGPGVGSGRLRGRSVHREVEEDAAARRTTALSTEADLGGIVEKDKFVRAQPVGAEDEVRITTHVEISKGRFFIKVASVPR